MKELFNLLTDGERRAAAIAAAVAGVAACILIYAAVGAHAAAVRAADAAGAAKVAYTALDRERAAALKDWQAWTDAAKDLAGFRADRFYDGTKGLQEMRMDLQRIFDAAGVPASDIAYGYIDLVKGAVQRVNADFRFTASYAVLKGILDTVERSPRFLHVERVDFLGQTKQPGAMDLRVTFAGYYAY